MSRVGATRAPTTVSSPHGAGPQRPATRPRVKPRSTTRVTRPATAQTGGRDFRLQQYAQLLRRGSGLKIAVLSTNDDYGRSGERFLRQSYPDYKLVRARSLEQVVDRILREVDKARAQGSDAHISDLVILTHANEHGGLKLGVLSGDVVKRGGKTALSRSVTPWSLTAVSKEMRAGKHGDLAARRKQLIDAFDRTSKVVIRGCEFGRSDDGLRALQMFFGGQAKVYAPTLVQGFEAKQPTRGEEIALYDRLAQQGLAASEVTSAEKRRTIQTMAAKNGGVVATQFFVEPSDYSAYKQLGKAERMGSQAEGFKLRAAMPDPTLKHHLSALDRDDLRALARELQADYRPDYAPVLGALEQAWLARRPGEPPTGQPVADPNDPLAGLAPSELTVSNATPRTEQLAEVWRSSDETGALFKPGQDPFMAGDMRFKAPVDAERRVAESEFNETFVNDLSGQPLAARLVVERPVSNVGAVQVLSDGTLRLSNFGIGSTRLRAEFGAPLRDLAERAKSTSGSALIVTGHASTPGKLNDNASLALARAHAVAGKLVSIGVPAERIIVVGKGETVPVAADVTRKGVDSAAAAGNRRVDIRLDDRQRVVADPLPSDTAVSDAVAKIPRLGSDTFGRVLDITGIVLDVEGHLVELLSLPTRFGVIGLVGPVLDMVQHVNQMRRLKEGWRREGEIVGFKLGLEVAPVLAAAGKLDRNIEGPDLGREIVDASGREYLLGHDKDWQAFTRLSTYSTMSWDRRMEAVRAGVDRAATFVNTVMRTAEVELRRRLEAAGLSKPEIETAYAASAQRLRVKCAEALKQQIAKILESRDHR